MTCDSCRFWWQFRGGPDSEPEDRKGECRRHAPAIAPHAESNTGYAYGDWPVTMADDWCGDHEPGKAPGADEYAQDVARMRGQER